MGKLEEATDKNDIEALVDFDNDNEEDGKD